MSKSNSDELLELLDNVYEHAFMAGVFSERGEHNFMDSNIKKAKLSQRTIVTVTAQAVREASNTKKRG